MAPPAPSDPESLLWAHKLKREHCRLLMRVDELERQVQNSSLLKRFNDVEDELARQRCEADDLRKEMQEIRDMQIDIQKLKDDITTRLDMLEEKMKGCQDSNLHISLVRNSHLAASKTLVQRIVHLEQLRSMDMATQRQLFAEIESMQQDIIRLRSGSNHPKIEGAETSQQSITYLSAHSQQAHSLAADPPAPQKRRPKSPEISIETWSETAPTSPIRQGMVTRQLEKIMRRKSGDKKRKSEERISTTAPKKKPKKRDIPQEYDLPSYEEYIKA